MRKLRAYWSRLGFWPLGETGIYLWVWPKENQLDHVRRWKRSLAAASGLAGRRVC